MHFTSESSADGVTQRRFTLDGVPGVLWQPDGSALGGRPLVLLGHGGGRHKLGPGLVARARRPISAWVARHTAALAERAVPELELASCERFLARHPIRAE
ncbi:hypothetical protein ACFU7Y_01130 [Kitasatospora sp. NPDC057542]|uniref:hypothetical protein n=1 Tax=Kitasatospora sp. NPDC057542 TaxID=3346162 RepID=UPI00368F5709